MEFSQRAKSLTPSATRTIAEKGAALRAMGREIISFSIGEPDFTSPRAAITEAIAAMERGETKYTATAGITELRLEVVNYYYRRFGLNVTMKQVMIGAGAKPLLFEIFGVLLDPDDEVILIVPAWVSYYEQVKFFDAVPILVDAKPETFDLDIDAIGKKITHRTKAIVINSPNNPTGRVYDEASVTELLKLAKQHGIVVVNDEVYERITFDSFEYRNPLCYVPEAADILISINAVSKSYAMTGWRIGFAIGPEWVISKMTALQGHITSGASSISQWAAVGALRGEAEEDVQHMVENYTRRKEFVVSRLAKIKSIDFSHPCGAFYIFIDVTSLLGNGRNGTRITDDVKFCEVVLEECGVSLIPGTAFLKPGFVRLSFATSIENLRVGLDRLAQMFDALARENGSKKIQETKSAVIYDKYCPVRCVGYGEGHHFFGYYNKSPWSTDGKLLLAHRTKMLTGDLSGREIAEVGYFDLDDNESFHVVGTTTAWNWQMGAQLQWLHGRDERRIIYNVRAEEAGRGTPYPDFKARIHDIDTGETRDLPLPVYVVSPSGEYAMTVSYTRFIATHKTIGYHATGEEPDLDLAPADDGIYRIDVESGNYALIKSLAELSSFNHVPSMDGAIHWVTHMEINPASSRILFIHRWTKRAEDETCYLHRLMSMNPDGSDLRLLECTDHPLPQLEDDFDPDAAGTFDYEKSEYQISHPIWCDNDTIIVWGPNSGEIHYQIYNDRDGSVSTLGSDVLTENGHMSFFQGGEWLLSDTYPDPETNERILFLYNRYSGERFDVGSFYTPPDLGKHNRCDLHPRWNTTGGEVCIDSVHEGKRKMYIIDVSHFTFRHAAKVKSPAQAISR